MKNSYIVSVFECNRAYGGPEEGGWWYDTGDLVKIIRTFHSEKAAVSFSERMQRLLDKALNKGRYEPGSMLCNGWYTAEIHENVVPAFYPTKTPRYE